MPDPSSISLPPNQPEVEVTPGYLNSFSFGYFGTTIFYAIGMRLSVYQILLPLLIWVVVSIVAIPVGIILGFFPLFAPLGITLFKTVAQLYLLYRVSFSVRANAYKNRQWRSADDFMNCQAAWDTWGLMIFCGLICIGILFQLVAPKPLTLQEREQQAAELQQQQLQQDQNFQASLQTK